MAAAAAAASLRLSSIPLALFLVSAQLLLLLPDHVSPAPADRVLFEEGYSVATMIDGHKLGINPHSVLPVPGSPKLIVLDSVGSAFYSVPLPVSEDKDNAIKRLSGDGVAGYSDGELTSAQFNQPRSFAVDPKGNIYVADKRNHAIRKISSSGVTTIAGGFSQKAGRGDGPGRNASFSSDFELSFIPGSCSLLVSDHGNQLVREILLKEEDCGKSGGSPSPPVMGAVSIWALGLCLSGFLGLAVGIAIRPYIFPRERSNSLSFSGTWRHFLTHLEKQALTHCSGITNGVAKSCLIQLLTRFIVLSISHLSLMFRVYNVQKPTRSRESPSLLDSDSMNTADITRSGCSNLYEDQLKGLITFEENPNSWNLSDENQGTDLPGSGDKLDDMIRANLVTFEGMNNVAVQQLGSFSSGSISGLVKRR